jgi:hypothetical protein
VTRIAPGLHCDCISRACQSAIAHGVIDLATAQTDIGQKCDRHIAEGFG